MLQIRILVKIKLDIMLIPINKNRIRLPLIAMTVLFSPVWLVSICHHELHAIKPDRSATVRHIMLIAARIIGINASQIVAACSD